MTVSRTFTGFAVAGLLACGVPLAYAASPSEAAVMTVHTVDVPSSIDATGKTDVASQLNAFLAGVPDDSIVKFAADGRYRAEDTLKVTDKQRLVLDGNGATLFARTIGYRERSQINLIGGSDLVVKDFHIVGANPNPGVDGVYLSALEGQHGIETNGPVRVLIQDNTINSVYGDLIYIGRDLRKKLPTWTQSSQDITVRDNTLSGSGRQGVTFTQGSRILVEDNTIGDVKRTTFDMEPNGHTWLVDDVTIENNDIGLSGLNFISAAGRGPVNDISVVGNTLHGKQMMSVIKNKPGETRRNWSFVGNTSDRAFGSTLGGVVVGYGVQGLRFDDNVQPFNARRHMVGVKVDAASCGLVASGNTMVNSVAQSSGGEAACADGITVGAVTRPASAESPQKRA